MGFKNHLLRRGESPTIVSLFHVEVWYRGNCGGQQGLCLCMIWKFSLLFFFANAQVWSLCLSLLALLIGKVQAKT